MPFSGCCPGTSWRSSGKRYGADELLKAIRFDDALFTRGEQPFAFGLGSVESGQAIFLALVASLADLSYQLRDAPVRPERDDQEHHHGGSGTYTAHGRKWLYASRSYNVIPRAIAARTTATLAEAERDAHAPGNSSSDHRPSR